jgi:TolB-like protein/Tfp pilus assembly protein PilF
MARRRPRVLGFIRELRRRHVIKVLVAYVAMAFVVMQAADILFPALGFPAWTMTFVVTLLGLGLPLAAVLAWAYDLSPEGVVRTSRVDAALAAASAPEPSERVPPGPEPRPAEGSGQAPLPDAINPRSIVVLPLSNLSADPGDRYFSDGVTEDITAHLARLGDLRVISRTSAMAYRDARVPLRQIGQDLGVAVVLEGSVRRHGNRVRIVAQLIDAASDGHLWSETYDRDIEDIFEIQSDVARRIASALDATLSSRERARMDDRPTRSLEAYEAYLRGRHAWNTRTVAGLAESIRHLEDATRIDPGFALAWANLADSRVVQALYGAEPALRVMPLALESAAKALAIEPRLGEALAARATVRGLHEWDWTAAETDFRRALECSPQYATGHQWFALHLLAPLRRFEEAHAALERARELDPVSSAILAATGFVLILEGKPERAAAVLNRTTESDSSFAIAHLFLGQARLEMGDHAGALAALDRALELRGGDPEVRATRLRVHAAAGLEVEDLMIELRSAAGEGRLSPTRMAAAELAAGRPDDALAWLGRARESRAPDLAWLASDPAFRELRDDPRFMDLLARLGLG